MAVIKISKFCKSMSEIKARVNYTNKFGTAIDQAGIPVDPDRIDELFALRKVRGKKLATNFSISLPNDPVQAGKAADIARELLIERYPYLSEAYHHDPQNRHLDVTVYNIDKNYFGKKYEVLNLRKEYERRCTVAGIQFTFRRGVGTKKWSRAEKHLEERGLETWKGDIRGSVSSALKDPKSVDFQSFSSILNAKGVKISRQTSNSLTFVDSQGHKVRLSKLFNGMNSRQDLDNYISKKSKSTQVKKVKAPAAASPIKTLTGVNKAQHIANTAGQVLTGNIGGVIISAAKSAVKSKVKSAALTAIGGPAAPTLTAALSFLSKRKKKPKEEEQPPSTAPSPAPFPRGRRR